ncbi:peptidoglycan editing factor PgeF [Thalassospira alkalitolerans]|uniref:peptidoglycan editing factor PgeF n=1 Tax=Thalassospira alkalitolerans TaxID=1293890 RepID=UPI0030EBF239|tara:strand:+ start:37084 stop:37905 length:822 start_codon:yes stop_codon:yes gene_type:complete
MTRQTTRGIERKANGLMWLEAKSMQAREGLRHGFLTRKGGISDGIHGGLNVGFGSDDSRDRVSENRARAARVFGTTQERLTTVYQVHGIDVAVLDHPLDRSDAPKADAMVTDRPDIMLGILTADCTPVLFHDAKAGVIGACHSGWRGSFAGISEATVAAMEKLGASRGDITAAVGPCIARPSYEVDGGFRDTILSGPSGDDDLFDPSVRAGHFMFDLPEYVLRRTMATEIAEIELVARDTLAEEDLFYSYRRTTLRKEPDYGRQLSAIMLAGG